MAQISEDDIKKRNRALANGFYMNSKALACRDYFEENKDGTISIYFYYYRLLFFERVLPMIKGDKKYIFFFAV